MMLSTTERQKITEAMRIMGSIKSKAKAKSSKANAKLGGWPKGRKRKSDTEGEK